MKLKSSTLQDISTLGVIPADTLQTWTGCLDGVTLTASDENELHDLLEDVRRAALRLLLGGSVHAGTRVFALAANISELIRIHEMARAEF
jgi:hypothetical protein